MPNWNDPVHLLGQDIASVVARLAGSDRHRNPLDLAETQAVFTLVAQRAQLTLPPLAARDTAALLLGPVASLATSVDQLDLALLAIFEWLAEHPVFVLRGMGRSFDPVDRQFHMLRRNALDVTEQDAVELQAEWKSLLEASSTVFQLGIHVMRIVACGTMLQVRIQDPETSAYLALAHLPIEPGENREPLAPAPQLTA